ncbi:MAG: YwhD family protein [Alicyclobacillus herbarius]|uniref:YwhD family protein n=1 Tax=Alicyclobacillus herbarius TaxID=122960 RepID=UPI0003F7B3B5|nr:YwhD family protein [Alicyclobacillus herbarius]MCL6631568.1 YwhD family protein [Alicyclobacillus herbarius]
MELLRLTSRPKPSTDNQMRGMSAVIIDGERVFVDNGAIHAKSGVERGIRFVTNPEEVPHPRRVWICWVTLHRFDSSDGQGKVQGYYGLQVFPVDIDAKAKIGYKSLSESVNKMGYAVKGRVDIEPLPWQERVRLRNFLQGLRPDLWEHASPDFVSAFASNDGTNQDKTRDESEA